MDVKIDLAVWTTARRCVNSSVAYQLLPAQKGLAKLFKLGQATFVTYQHFIASAVNMEKDRERIRL